MKDKNSKKQNPITNPSDPMVGDHEKIAMFSIKLSKEQIDHINLAAATFTQNMEAIRSTILASVKPFMVMREQMLNAIKPMVERRAEIEQLTSHFIKSFTKRIEGLQKFVELSKKVPENLRQSLIILGQEGWYLDYDITPAETWEFAQTLELGDVDLAQSKLVEHYQERAQDIFKHVVTAFPHRESILMQAANAHKRGEYALSVPVILAQSDGICQELTGLELFKKRDGKPVTSILVESSCEDEFRSALLHPLSMVLPISTSKKSTKDTVGHLNRHEVLHGISLGYGTEVNSLKAISLLFYIVSVLSPEA